MCVLAMSPYLLVGALFRQARIMSAVDFLSSLSFQKTNSGIPLMWAKEDSYLKCTPCHV